MVPKLSAFIRHRSSLALPQDQPRIGQELLRHERQHSGSVGISNPEHFSNFGKHRRQLFRGIEVASLSKVAPDLLLDLELVQVPSVRFGGIIGASGGRIRSAVDLVDFRFLVEQDLIGQFLSRGKHIRVMFGDEILDKLLQLLATHLKQCF